jgi:hypothetical protein
LVWITSLFITSCIAKGSPSKRLLTNYVRSDVVPLFLHRISTCTPRIAVAS